jgi:serine/threonine protein phosphatase PrpC
LGRAHPDVELPIELKHEASCTLGLAQRVEPEFSSGIAHPNDVFLLCSSEVWARCHDWIVSYTGEPNELLRNCAPLTDDRGANASACILTIDGRRPTSR